MEDDSKSHKICEKYSPTFETTNGITKLALDNQEASSTIQQNHGSSDTTNSIKTVMTKQNATNFHPLMLPSVSQDFPDLIPENQRSKIYRTDCHSTMAEAQLNTELEQTLEAKLNMALSSYGCYDEKIQGSELFLNVKFIFLMFFYLDFPESPSVLKDTLKFDMPIEVSADDLSDTENEKSAYEAHLNYNLQNVSLVLNQKEGINCYILVHNGRCFNCNFCFQGI